MTDADILTGPIAKIERAKHHINDLNRQVGAYLAQRPLRYIKRTEPQSARIVHTIKSKIPMPQEFPMIIGDAIHNLRSALDIIVFGIVGEICKAPRQAQFPFTRNADSLDAAIDQRQIRCAGEKVVEQIKELKPYPGGNNELSGLHELDMTDKHKLIIPVGRTAAMSSNDFSRIFPSIEGKDGVTIIMHESTQFVTELKFSNRREKRAFRSNPVTEEETEIQPTFTICFADSQPFPLQPVVPTLIALATETDRAVRLINDAAKTI